jgi:pimeloyl-ACP methyl ester carboxylesterase
MLLHSELSSAVITVQGRQEWSARQLRILPGAILACLIMAPTASTVAQPAARPPVQAQEEALPEPKDLTLQTSDGIDLAVLYFPAPGDDKPEATVILVHDLGSSGEKLDPLAEALQAAGCAVLVPDLRGHGGSSIPAYAKQAAKGEQWKLLKLPDFVAMARTAGGRVRGQSDIRGDLEAIRNWIKQQADAGKLDLDKLVVVGSGLGGAVAAAWTVADAAWPLTARGPQGGHVCGLVLVDPTFTTKGFSIGPPLAAEPVKSTLPIMILASAGSRDAGKIFDQLKRARPSGWFDSRLYDAEARENKSPSKDTEASLLYLQVDARSKQGAPLTGDELAALSSPDPQRRTPASLIAAFVKTKAVQAR